MSPPTSRRLVAGLAAFCLSGALVACGADDPGVSSPDSAGSTSASEAQSDSPEEPRDSGSAALPGDFPDFPLPDDFEVTTVGVNGSAATAILSVSMSWQDAKAFYLTELPKAGWEVVGDRPFVAKEGTEIDATKADDDVTVGVSEVSGNTAVVINIVSAS